MKKRPLSVGFCLLLLAPLGAQTASESEGSSETAAARAQAQQETLQSLIESLQARRDKLASARAAAQSAQGDAKKKLDDAAAALAREVAVAAARFEQLAAGVDTQLPGGSTKKEAFNLGRELESLLQPLIEQLKTATETPRQIERLRKEIALAEQRRGDATTAIANLEERIATSSGPLRAELEALHKTWSDRRQELTNTMQLARFELERKLSQSQSLLESTSNLADSFFRRRGLNLLFALLAFFTVFFGLRLAYQTFHRVSPFKRSEARRLPGRIADVLFHGFVIVAALGATLLVLYVTNDWVLLVVTLIFLLGIGWASIHMLPRLFEQVRLILNFGSVREGERILWDGLPWRVSSLGIYAVLENPALRGGWLRIPVRDMIGKLSRPMDEREGWFPTEEGDWVILADGTRARVAVQSPERVRLELPGGGPMFMPAPAFLGGNPRNLSQGFRIELTFGVDYAHQAICTSAMVPIMDARIRTGLLSELVSEEELLALEVEFKEAAASSLDFEIQADFAGTAADRYEPIERAIARLLVDACNENGWVIPFQQITLHKAS